jgi:hypothetical protein
MQVDFAIPVGYFGCDVELIDAGSLTLKFMNLCWYGCTTLVIPYPLTNVASSSSSRLGFFGFRVPLLTEASTQNQAFQFWMEGCIGDVFPSGATCNCPFGLLLWPWSCRCTCEEKLQCPLIFAIVVEFIKRSSQSVMQFDSGNPRFPLLDTEGDHGRALSFQLQP